jgi:hypothetical protein
VASNNSLNRSAVPIFITLVALNFAIFVVNVLFFLPDHQKSDFVVETRMIIHEQVSAAEALRQALYKTNDEVISYDVVPKILQNSSAYGVVHHLPSIPAHRRMISDGNYASPTPVNKLAYFLESREEFPEEDRPLYLYNPMLLPLDDQVIDSELINELSSGMQNNVAYIGVFRVSNFANCFGPGRGVPKTYANFLGLALLDRELNVVRDPVSGEYLDAVIDLNKHLWELKWRPFSFGAFPKKPKQYMQDCQLFPARSGQGEKSVQLVLLCNEYAMPVQLKLRRSSASERVDQSKDHYISFVNMYGNFLHLIAQQEPNMIVYAGKNMHYFNNHDRSFLEIWPGGPHEVALIDFKSYPYVPRPNGYSDEEDRDGFARVEQIKAFKTEPMATFLTETDVHLFNNRSMLQRRDSGSTCCVKINWKADESGDERELLLGFSHTKTRPFPKRFQYSYFSRVYAFEPNPPFEVVARSGLFCLGFASDNETIGRVNELVRGATNFFKLRIFDEEYDCPRIHFVTGITEKYGDSETVIISYGVNDCYPRMIEVSKAFLVSLLRSE